MKLFSFDTENKTAHLNGETAFYFFQTYGFPAELFREIVMGWSRKSRALRFYQEAHELGINPQGYSIIL